jgi:hypothetical protein
MWLTSSQELVANHFSVASLGPSSFEVSVVAKYCAPLFLRDSTERGEWPRTSDDETREGAGDGTP